LVVETEDFRIFTIKPENLVDRLIVETYLPENLEVKEKLRGNPSLGNVADIRCGKTPHDKSAFYGGNILFLKTQHVQEGYLKLKDKFYVNAEAQDTLLKNSKVYPEDVLLTIIGASFEVIGRAATFPKELGEANINQNIARIRLFNTDKIRPEYVEAFLNSPIGRKQSQMISRVVGQYNLNLVEVRAIKIPIPPLEVQQTVIDLWNKAKATRKENLSKIRHLSEIELPDLNKSTFFKTKPEDLGEKLIVEYYRSKLIESILEKEKKRLTLLPLKELVTLRHAYMKPKETPKRFYQLLKISNSGFAYLREERLGEEIKYETMKIVRTGDMVVSRIGAIYGATAIVPEIYDNSLVSNEFHVLIPKQDKVASIYLWKVLRSSYFKGILEGYVTGGSRLRIKEEKLIEMLIPVPDLKIQQTLSKLVSQAIRQSRELQKEIRDAKEVAKTKIATILLQNVKTYESVAKDVISKSRETLKELAKY
jgi:type I restriction enzyme S subunit